VQEINTYRVISETGIRKMKEQGMCIAYVLERLPLNTVIKAAKKNFGRQATRALHILYASNDSLYKDSRKCVQFGRGGGAGKAADAQGRTLAFPAISIQDNFFHKVAVEDVIKELFGYTLGLVLKLTNRKKVVISGGYIPRNVGPSASSFCSKKHGSVRNEVRG